MDRTVDVVEHVEQFYGEAIQSRNKSIARLGERRGIGPPDLVWLTKVQYGPKGQPQTDPTGYYHWVLGRLVGGEAEAAAYFMDVLHAQEKPGATISGLVSLTGIATALGQTQWRITQGVYCLYDALHRIDIRVRMAIPGGVTVEAVGPDLSPVAVTEELWQGALVCGMVRATLMDPAIVALPESAGQDRSWLLNALRIVDFVRSPTDERRVEAALKELAAAGHLSALASWVQVPWDRGGGTTAEDLNPLGCALNFSLHRMQRAQRAAQLFESLTYDWPVAATYASFALRVLGEHTKAAGVLRAALARIEKLLGGEEPPEGVLRPAAQQLVEMRQQLHVALGWSMLECQEPKQALAYAEDALEDAEFLGNPCRPAWVLAARANVALGMPAAALLCLNAAPGTWKAPASVLSVLVVEPPEPFDTTSPRVDAASPEKVLAERIDREMEWAGDDELATLPALGYLSPRALSLKAGPGICLSNSQASVYAALYEILVALVQDLGWDQTLEWRSKVFLMESQRAAHDAEEEVRADVRTSAETSPDEEEASLEEDAGGGDAALARARGAGVGGAAGPGQGGADGDDAADDEDDGVVVQHRHEALAANERFSPSAAERAGRGGASGVQATGGAPWRDQGGHATSGEGVGGAVQRPRRPGARQAGDGDAGGAGGAVGDGDGAARVGSGDRGSRDHAFVEAEDVESPGRADARIADAAEQHDDGGEHDYGSREDEDVEAADDVAGGGGAGPKRAWGEGEEEGEEGAGRAEDSAGPGGDLQARAAEATADVDGGEGGAGSDAEREAAGADSAEEEAVSDGEDESVGREGSVGSQYDADYSSSEGSVRGGQTVLDPRLPAAGSGAAAVAYVGSRPIDSDAPLRPMTTSAADGDGRGGHRSHGSSKTPAALRQGAWKGAPVNRGVTDAAGPSAGPRQRRVRGKLSWRETLYGENTREVEGEDGGAEVVITQVECQLWLDDLILALYHDIDALTSWLNAEAKLRSWWERERVMAAGASDSDDENMVPGAGGPAVPTFSQIGWLSLGLLSERLKRVPDAERALRTATHPSMFSRFSIVGVLGLLRLYARLGWARETADCLVEALKRVHELAGASVLARPPMAVTQAFCEIVVQCGLEDVETFIAQHLATSSGSRSSRALTSLWSLVGKPVATGQTPSWKIDVDTLMREAVRWHVDGYDG
ncbi:unnamed protein product [Pedinophyceae sp. YPF-701]|nr:unnamed protein product [Pedinophyceae sp. YPF-701]